MSKNIRKFLISLFVIVWSLFFFYQTFRLNYINPWLKAKTNIELSRVPLLFPPAGWIMFYSIGTNYGFTEVYAVKDRKTEKLNKYDIFEIKAVGYDNFHRNVLVGVLYQQRANMFCSLLRRKFKGYDSFSVAYVNYPDLINTPDKFTRQLAYRCAGK